MSSKAHIAIVSGASRGFGKAIAKSLINDFNTRDNGVSHILLLGRDQAKLKGVQDELNLNIEKNIAIECFSDIEFSDITALETRLKPIKEYIMDVTKDVKYKSLGTKKLWLFNNHGTLGDIARRATEFNTLEVNDYLAVNFVSFTYLCNQFKIWSKVSDFTDKIVINSSSLSAIEPQPGLSLYSSIKAAREAYIKVISKEESDIKTLNYSPGPMDGNMQTQLRTKLFDEELKATLTNLFEDGMLVDMEDSARKLIKVLNLNNFESGSRIDYYDL